MMTKSCPTEATSVMALMMMREIDERDSRQHGPFSFQCSTDALKHPASLHFSRATLVRYAALGFYE